MAELAAIGEEVYDEVIADKIWPGTHALAQLHLDAGQRVWLVTATPVEVADVIARRLGLSGALGTVAESVDGVYTGRLVGEPLHGQAKADAVLALAEREGLDLSPLRGLLRLGQRHPDAVPGRRSPARSTRTPPCGRTPRLNGWRIRDYRTGRKAAKVGVPAAAGVGAAVGGVFAGLALRRRRQRRTALRRLVRRLTR